MQKKLLAISYSLIVISFFLPVLSFAHAPNIWAGGYWGNPPLLSCTGGTCANLCDLVHTVIHILYFIMSIAVYIATPILFAWGGLKIIVSTGNPGKVSEGKKIVTGTLVGVLITLGAFLVISTFLKVLGVTAVGGFGGELPVCTL